MRRAGASGNSRGAAGDLSGLFSLPAERPRLFQTFVWMGRKRMEEQWWKGELAADVHQTLRTKVGSRFIPFLLLLAALSSPAEEPGHRPSGREGPLNRPG